MHKVVLATFYYNRGSEVDVTLRSMIATSDRTTQIIAVDDGSTDDTYQQLMKFKSNQVEIISGNNRGLTRCLYETFENVESEYIAICGSGDICHPDRLKVQVAFMDANPHITFCGTASRNIDAITRAEVDIQDYTERELTAQDFFHSPPFTHGSVIIRTDAYKKVGGYDQRFYFSQDWDLWFRLLSIGPGYFINNKLYDRRLLLDGASFSPKKAELQLIYKYLAIYFYNHNNQNRDELLNNFDVNKVISKLLLKDLLKKNLSSRYIKLIAIKDYDGADKLHMIAKDQYEGIDFKYRLLAKIIILLTKSGINYITINKMLRFVLNFTRKNEK